MDVRKIKTRLAKERESSIEAYFVKQVREANGWPIKFWPLSLAGFPDRIVIWRDGRIQFVELKRPGAKPRPLQLRIHERLRMYNAFVAVLATREEVDLYVDAQRPARLSTESN